MSRIAWLVGISVLVMVVNIAVSVFYMFIYGHLIDPGHESSTTTLTSRLPRHSRQRFTVGY